MADLITAIPMLGAGIGYRREMSEQTFAASSALDLVEIITEQFIDETTTGELENLCASFRVLPHGVGLSIGSPTLPDSAYLRAVKRVVDLTDPPFYSEHLCMTRAPGIDLGHLAPLAFTPTVLARTAEHVDRMQDFLGRPLILENIAHLFKVGVGTLREEAFFRELTDHTGCGLLLDLTNIRANAANFDEDAAAAMDRMPLDRVVQVHLAGGYWTDNVFVDGHSHPVDEELWSLLSRLAARITVKACVIERDDNLPDDVGPLLAEAARARDILMQTGIAAPEL